MIDLNKRIALLVLTAGSLAAGSASAADYEPPIAVQQADEYVPVEVGSGWYLRGDVGYVFDKSFDDLDRGSIGQFPDYGDFGAFVLPSYEDDNTDIVASIGFGYHFNDYLRADVNAGYLPNEKYDIGDSLGDDVRFSAKNSYYTGMVNGYVDLGTFAGLTPYVGAGVGVLHTKTKVKASASCATVNSFAGQPDGEAIANLYCKTDDEDEVADVGYSKTDYDILYAANAGFSYLIARNTSLDVGYQYMIAPNANYVQIDGGGLGRGEGFDSHTVKVGLRYDLW